MTQNPQVTVIIPTYNEAATIEPIIDQVLKAPFDKQIVVVDDGSTDGTTAILRRRAVELGEAIILLQQPKNSGKGAAIRAGLAIATGIVTLIQDADLEYDPSNYPLLVNPILNGQADVVYGSRYLRPPQSLPWTANRCCVILLNWTVRILFGQRLTDEATCYKAARTDLLRRLDLQASRFDFCPEVTAKFCINGIRIYEVPISYHPRGHHEGKKIRWWDGIEAFLTLLRWRLRGKKIGVTECASISSNTIKTSSPVISRNN